MKTTKRASRALVVTALGGALLLAGCTAAPSSGDLPEGSESALGGTEALDQFAELYQAALDAGKTQVVIYGPPRADNVTAAFEARFPGIEIAEEQLQGADRDVRLDAEASSGNYAGDVLSDGSTPVTRSAADGRCQPFTPILDVPDEWMDLDDQVLLTNLSIFGTVYNPDLIAEEDLPRSWQELLDPEYKGQFSIVSPAVGGVATYTFAIMLTDENNSTYGVPFLEGLKAQEPNFVGQDALAVQAVANGETPFAALVYKPFFTEAKAEGASIEFFFPIEEDNMWTASAVCQAVNSPNEDAARLYLNWLYSPEGQAEVAASGTYPIMPGAEPTDGLPPIAEVSLIPQLEGEEALTGYDTLIPQVIELFS